MPKFMFQASLARGLRGAGRPDPATVVIHGTVLSPENLGDMADAGAKLVWSPQSKLRLYAQTTQAGAALDAGVAVGLWADWLPSEHQPAG